MQRNTSVGNFMFYECSSLRRVIFSKYVSIGVYLFEYSFNVEYVEFLGESPPECKDTLAHCCEMHAVVPCNYTSHNFCGMPAYCEENFTWSYEESEHKLTINGRGEMNYRYYPWWKYRDDIYTVVINGVTSIGKNVFLDCTNLIDVKIFSRIQYIGESAFEGCSRLSDIDLPSGLTRIDNKAFAGCELIKSIWIPSTVEYVDGSAFSNCSNLQSIVVEENSTNLVSIDGVLYSHDMQTLIWFPPTNNYNSYYVPYGVKSIGPYAFYYRKNLEKIFISSSVTSIGIYAFSQCDLLKVVIMSSGITSIGHHAFYNCFSLSSIDIPSGVTSIGNYTFYQCTSLKSVTVASSGITSIENHAFYDCSSLTSFDIPSSVTSIGSFAFYGCSQLTAVVIPQVTLSVGENSFYKCTNLKSITIPSCVTSFRDICDGSKDLYSIYVYDDNPHFKSVDGVLFTRNGTTLIYFPCGRKDYVIPDHVTAIGELAFYRCNTSLESVTIPSSVKSIGERAFFYTTKMQTVIYLGKEKPDCGYDSFYACSVSFIIVPSDYSNCSDVIGEYGQEDCERDVLCIPDSCGANFSWSFDNTTSTLVVEGNGEMEDMIRSRPWSLIGHSIRRVVVKEGVTSLGYDAFANLINLESVSLPSTITTISHRAFYGCIKLESISLPSSITYIGECVFQECHSLYSVSIPDGVTKISKATFYNCNSLVYVTIPPTVTSIGNYSFYGCSSLMSISLPSSITSIGEHAFYGCSSLDNVTIPPTVTYIGNYSFYGCSNLMSISLPSGIKSIGEYAFHGCSNLTSISLPSGITSIRNNVFYGCSSLDNVTIPPTVTSIGNYAFYGCSNLTSISLPSSITSIGEYAFCDSINLESITIPSTVSILKNTAFSGCFSLNSIYVKNETLGKFKSYDGVLFHEEDDGLTLFKYPCGSKNHNDTIPLEYHYDIPNNISGVKVSSVASHAFNCTASVSVSGFLSITIPPDVNIIDSAFTNCSILKNVIISEKVTSLPSFVFCGNLESITIPSTVETIPRNNFYECHSLKSVYLAKGVKTIEKLAFQACENLLWITIPSGVEFIDKEAFENSNIRFVTYNDSCPCHNPGFNSLPSDASVCVPEGCANEICGDRVFCKPKTNCSDVYSSLSECYEVIDVNNECTLRKTSMARSWENKTNGCLNYTCEDSFMFHSNCQEDQMCVNNQCVKISSMDDKYWRVDVDLDGSDLLSIPSFDVYEEVNRVFTPIVDVVGMNMEDNGNNIRIYAFVDNQEAAASISAQLNNCS